MSKASLIHLRSSSACSSTGIYVAMVCVFVAEDRRDEQQKGFRVVRVEVALVYEYYRTTRALSLSSSALSDFLF